MKVSRSCLWTSAPKQVLVGVSCLCYLGSLQPCPDAAWPGPALLEEDARDPQVDCATVASRAAGLTGSRSLLGG